MKFEEKDLDRFEVACTKCGLRHDVCDLSRGERESVEEDHYGRDRLTFKCLGGCGEVKSLVWLR